MKRIHTIVLCALPLFALPGCITDPVTGNRVFGMPTSDEAESAQGLQYRPLITQQYSGPYPDQEAQQYLGGLVLHVAKTGVRPDLPWTFTLLNTSVPNAFAVPGGQVFVTRGLLARLADEAEFVVVMGHEIGHVEHRHSVQGAVRDTGVALLGSVLASKVGGGADQIVGLGVQGAISKFSRDQEREADVRGVDHSYLLGYDPREGADVFRAFLAMKAEAGGDGGIPWLSSHPADEERIDSVLALSAATDARLAGTAPVPGLVVTTPTFARIVARIRQDQQVYDRYDEALSNIGAANGSEASLRAALPEMEAVARQLQGHALPSSTLGKVYLALGNNDAAAPWLTRAAAMNQGLVEPEYLLGVLSVRRKRWDDAVAHSDRAMAILPQDYRPLFVRAQAHQGAGRTQQATADFQAVLQAAPAGSTEYKESAAALGSSSGARAPAARRAKR